MNHDKKSNKQTQSEMDDKKTIQYIIKATPNQRRNNKT